MDFLHRKGRFSHRAAGLPRLILLDLKMPRMNGFEVLERIKADSELKLIPVIALTSSREERDVERAYDLSVNGYVVKSINFTDYRATLQALANYWASINERPPGLEERRVIVAARSAAQVDRRAATFRNTWFWPLSPC